MDELPSATCVAVLLARVDAIRVEYNGDIQHFDDVESHLNRHGLTCVE
jgi:tRNA-dihydrouridine synthase